MASNILLIPTTFLLLLASAASTTLDPSMFPHGPEKQAHLHFFFHDIVSGRNPTAIQVASAPSTANSSTFFGSVSIMDDPLTVGPNMSSTLIGRAQGLYASASKENLGLLMNLNFVFLHGDYNGSTLAVLGSNRVFDDVREMTVVGGTGVFRWARGIARAHTRWLDLKTGDAVVEYNVYVLHY